MNDISINNSDISQEEIRMALEKMTTPNGIEVVFCYSSDFSNTKVLRTYIEQICELMKLENKWKSRLILITDELNNNAIEYGSLNGEVNFMRIKIESTSEGVKIFLEIEDSGNGSHHKTSQEMEQLRQQRTEIGFKNHDSIRGRGLFMIIASLVDTLSFHDSPTGGLIVAIKKDIPLTTNP